MELDGAAKPTNQEHFRCPEFDLTLLCAKRTAFSS